MEAKVDDAVNKYETSIEPLIKNVSKITDEHSTSLYDMWDLKYHVDIEPPQETKHSWADMTEYDDICRHIKAMKDGGYPDINNIRPLKELRSSTADLTENKFQIANEKSTKKNLEYYEYEVNNTTINLPIANYLDDIQPCFYYYEGDRKHQPGVYMSPFSGVVMQVPTVTVVPYSMENSNYYSMKCKEGASCKNVRCTYAHPGTDYIKIGCVSRCPHAHSFGNKDTLSDDLKVVNIEDIRIVSMYGLNDLFSAALWFSNKINKQGHRVIHDLEVCDNYTDQEFIRSDEIESDEFN